MTPKTLLQAVRYFSDRQVCHDYMRKLKWPSGTVTCPKCGGDSCKELASRPGVLKCNKASCQKQFSFKVGTIFEDSPLGLDKWFVAVWAIANCKNGISSHELARAIGVTQKTAWHMLHRIRKAMETDSFHKIDGTVEVDETFVGGKAKNMHKARREKLIEGRGPVGKTAVQGILQRGGEVRTFVVPVADANHLQANVQRNVDRRATVYTDAATAYAGLCWSYLHKTIDHVREFVRDQVHTNGIENFWCLLKRSVKGTYTKVAPFHLHRYASEQEFRYNHRQGNDGSRFDALMQRVIGRRLTYRQLAAIGDCGFMGIQ